MKSLSLAHIARAASVLLALAVTLPLATQAKPGYVLSHQKISDTEGGFNGELDENDRIGVQIANIGDFDGDDVVDIAVGASLDDDGGIDRGAVWLMYLNNDGTVKAHQKISADSGGFSGSLDDFDRFGRVASLGDLDGDTITDLAVGADQDDDGGFDRGAVWILFLNSDGTVNHHQKISDTEGNFAGTLRNDDSFGWSVATLPDVDGDDVPDLAVGAPANDWPGPISDAGAVWILFLNTDGTVKDYRKIANGRAGFPDTLEAGDGFGNGVASLGDLDDDGVPDLAVGAISDDDGGSSRGAVWILFLNANGSVKAHQKISDTEGGFTGILMDGDNFCRVTSLPDVDGDGVEDLAVGAPGDDDGGPSRGAMWILFLNNDGTVKGQLKISDTRGGFTGVLDDSDLFGWSGAWLGDLDDDGKGDLAAGALFDDDGGNECGAVWVLFLGDVPTAIPGAGSPHTISFAASPNPFRGQTAFEYALSNASAVRLLIFDARGRRVTTLVDRGQSAGVHSTTWSGRDANGAPVGAGVYFARLEAAGRTGVQKIVVLK